MTSPVSSQGASVQAILPTPVTAQTVEKTAELAVSSIDSASLAAIAAAKGADMDALASAVTKSETVTVATTAAETVKSEVDALAVVKKSEVEIAAAVTTSEVQMAATKSKVDTVVDALDAAKKSEAEIGAAAIVKVELSEAEMAAAVKAELSAVETEIAAVAKAELNATKATLAVPNGVATGVTRAAVLTPFDKAIVNTIFGNQTTQTASSFFGKLKTLVGDSFTGYIPTLKVAIPSNIILGTVLLGTYPFFHSIFSKIISTNHPILVDLSSYSASGALMSLCRAPTDAAIQHIQMGATRNLKESIKQLGIKGLLQGSPLSMAMSAITSPAFIVGSEQMQKAIETRLGADPSKSNSSLLSIPVSILSGGSVNAAITTLTFPVFRVIMEQRAQGQNSKSAYQTTRELWQKGGVKELTKGVVPAGLRSVAAGGVIIGTIEAVKQGYLAYQALPQRPASTRESGGDEEYLASSFTSA